MIASPRVVADHGDEVTPIAAGASPSAELWAAEDCELAVGPGDDVAGAAIAHLGGVRRANVSLAQLEREGIVHRRRGRIELRGSR